MFFLLRDFFEFLTILCFGEFFFLADILIQARKGEFKKPEALRSTCLLFRFAALFFLALAFIFVGEQLHVFCSNTFFAKHFCFLLIATFFTTSVIFFFCIIIPRCLRESDTSSKPTHFLNQLLLHFLFWISPLFPVLDAAVIKTLRFLGISFRENHTTSDQEVMHMMDEGLHAGVFNVSEREMVEGVLELDEQTASSLMTPRSHVIFLNLEDENEKNWRRIISSGHSEFPVFQEKQDNVVGMVSVKALWANLSMADSAKLADLMMPPLYVFSNMTAPKIIEEFRAKKHHTALVVDEFGVIEGIITLKDVMESILGMLPEREVKGHYPEIKKEKDGTWIVDAMVHYEEACKKLGFASQDTNKESRYQTVGGFFLHHLGHIPKIGESILIENFRLQVFSMSHYRIDKIRVTRLEKEENTSGE